MMKSMEEMEAALERVPDDGATRYPGMSYEDGVREALCWALGDIPDDEFEYAG